MEHEDQARRAEQQADDLEERSRELGEELEGTRSEWEAREHDPSVPGAQPDPGEEEESRTGVETNPSRVSEQGGP
jgi:hypothetical protein